MQTEALFELPVTMAEGSEEIVDALEARLAAREPMLVTFVNPQAWTLARRDTGFAPLLTRFDLVLPDGIGVARTAAWLKRRPVARLSFDASSLYHPVFRTLEARRGSLFIIGAAPGVAEQAAARMQEAYPGIRLEGCLDGYAELKAARARILEADPDLVLCGMGAPRQERFLAGLKAAGFRGVAFTCGGFLDQLAQAETYYPAWIDRLELRWLYRIWMEPGRLWRRYAIDYLPFLRLAAGGLLRRGLGGLRPSFLTPRPSEPGREPSS